VPLSLSLAFSPPPPPPPPSSSTGSLAARSLANGARPAVGPRLVARPCRRQTLDQLLGLQCVYFFVCILQRGRLCRLVILCVFVPLCIPRGSVQHVRAKVDFATNRCPGLTRGFFFQSLARPDLFTDIFLTLCNSTQRLHREFLFFDDVKVAKIEIFLLLEKTEIVCS
jgi:hypothetical protein